MGLMTDPCGVPFSCWYVVESFNISDSDLEGPVAEEFLDPPIHLSCDLHVFHFHEDPICPEHVIGLLERSPM